MGIGSWLLLLRMVNRAIWVGTDFAEFAFLRAFRDDGLGRRFARLVLRPFALLVVLWLLLFDLDVLVARNRGAAFGWFAVSCGDLSIHYIN